MADLSLFVTERNSDIPPLPERSLPTQARNAYSIEISKTRLAPYYAMSFALHSKRRGLYRKAFVLYSYDYSTLDEDD